jgi:signal transduction histidine kinase
MIKQQSFNELILNYIEYYSTDLVLRLNSNGSIVHANKAVDQVCGKNVVGLSFTDIVLDWKHQFNLEDIKTGHIKKQALKINSSDDLPKSYDFNFQYLDNEIVCIGKVEFHHDIHIEKKLLLLTNELNNKTRELFQKNAQLQKNLKSKELLLSIISHDLRGPISSVKGILSILHDRCEDYPTETMMNLLFDCLQAISNTELLAENLLSWVRSQTNQLQFVPQILDLNAIISRNIKLYRASAQAKKIKLSSSLLQSCIIKADSNMIDTVIRNLLANAIKFTDVDGKIELNVNEEEEIYNIEVIDNGIGMSKEDAAKVFDSNVILTTAGTQGEKGTGFGLILCKQFIEENGGKIEIESELYKGTTMRIKLNKHHE